METFTWRPILETPAEVSFNTFSAQFGDGYKQSVGNGINNKKESWSLSFTGRRDRIQEIRDFLDARKGYEAFLWTPKNGSEGIYDCTEYSVVNVSDSDSAGIWRLNATFTQRFGE